MWNNKTLTRAALLLSAGLALEGAGHAQQPPPPMPTYDGPTRRGQVPADAGPPPLPPGVEMPGGPPGGPPPGMGAPADVKYVAGVHIVDGRYDAASSMPSLVKATRVGDTVIDGLTITSDRGDLNGVLVQGDQSAVTLSNARMKLSGIGKDEFAGVGSGAMVTQGVLVLRHVSIETSGAIRTALVANDHAIMKVFDSDLLAHGGPLPATYVRHIGPGMMEAPPPLGISGTARTNLTMGQSESYFYRTRIVADGWGALSTDATGGYVYLEANDCDIVVNNSGYGTYADGGAHVAINKSRMKVATFGAIAAGSGEVRFTDVTGSAGRNVIMIHSVMGSTDEIGRFVMKGGSFTTGEAGVLVKSANADIDLDGATVRSSNGILVRGIVNDDANRTKVNGAKVKGITVRLMKGGYTGGLVMEDGERPMTVRLAKATLTGAIKGASVDLDEASRWTANADSEVTLVDPSDAARIDAPAGVVIRARGAGVRSAKLASGGTLTAAP